MWINGTAYRAWAQQVQDLKHSLTSVLAAVGAMQSQLVEKDRQIQLLTDQLVAHTRKRDEMVAEHARSVAAAGFWRTRINELTLERAALLTKLVPGLDLKVPTIQYTPQVDPPGASFEDMGDAEALHHSEGDFFPLGQPTRVSPGGMFDDNLDIGGEPDDTSAP